MGRKYFFFGPKSQAKNIHDEQMKASSGKRAERMAMWDKVRQGSMKPEEFEQQENTRFKQLYGKEGLANYGSVMSNMKSYFQYKQDKQLSPGLASQTIFRAGLGQNMAKSSLLGKA